MIVIDSAPIRKKARRDYDKVLRDLDEAKAERDRFHKEDRPNFQRWMSNTFGAALTEMRELEHKLLELESLVNEVQQEFFFGTYQSIFSAFERVKQRRAEPESDEEDEPDFERHKQSPTEEAEEAFRKLMEEMLADKEAAFQADEKGQAARARKASVAEQNRQLRIKDLYRTLVRRLHPDQAQNLSGQQVEWWHQTQRAYEAGNLEELEVILTLTEIEKGGANEASISILARITFQFKQALRALKSEIKEFRQDPAWNFSILKDLNGLQERMEKQLEREKSRIVWMTEKYQKQIQSWEQTRREPRKRIRKGSGSWREEELY